jgi:excisionase family DNA binding protein
VPVSIPFRSRLSCTVQEACAATGLGRTLLYEAIADGRVKTAKMGRRRLVLVSSLITLLGATSRDEVCDHGEV